MRCRRRISSRSLTVALFVALAALAVHFIVIPRIVRAQIASALARLDVEASSFTLTSAGVGGARVRQVRLGRMPWLTIDDARVRYGLIDLLDRRIHTLTLEGATWNLSIRDEKIDWGPAPQADDGEELLDLPFDRLELREARLVVRQDDGSVAYAMASGSLIRLSPGVFEIDLAIDGGAIAWIGSPLSLHQVAAQLNARLKMSDAGIAVRGQGTFALNEIGWNEVALPPLRGNLEFTERSATASAMWPFMQDALADLRASLTVEDGRPSGDIRATVPPFEITDSTLLGELLPRLASAQVGGTWSADARFTFAQGSLNTLIRVAARQASVRHPEWNASIDSASGQVTIDGLAPLSMPAGQRIKVHKATLGAEEITDGELLLTYESKTSVLIDQAAWRMGDLGSFRAAQVRFDPANPRLNLELVCSEVSLGAWAPRLTDDKLQAEGTLRGTVNLEVRPLARQKVRFGEGYLYADPPTGWIQIADADAISRVLERADAALESRGDWRLVEVKDRLVRALQDLQFTKLRLQFIPLDDGINCRIEIAGAGRAGPEPQEIGSLVLNVNGFDLLIKGAISGRSLME